MRAVSLSYAGGQLRRQICGIDVNRQRKDNGSGARRIGFDTNFGYG